MLSLFKKNKHFITGVTSEVKLTWYFIDIQNHHFPSVIK